MSNRIFIDTVFIVALVNERDQFHEQAVELSHMLEGSSTLTTDAVLLEIGNALARSNKQAAVDAIERLLTSDDVEVINMNPQLFEQAFLLYKAYQDKAWGLVDCVSFVAMREARVTQALTLDKHFEQAGFQVLMTADPQN